MILLLKFISVISIASFLAYGDSGKNEKDGNEESVKKCREAFSKTVEQKRAIDICNDEEVRKNPSEAVKEVKSCKDMLVLGQKEDIQAAEEVCCLDKAVRKNPSLYSQRVNQCKDDLKELKVTIFIHCGGAVMPDVSCVRTLIHKGKIAPNKAALLCKTNERVRKDPEFAIKDGLKNRLCQTAKNKGLTILKESKEAEKLFALSDEFSKINEFQAKQLNEEALKVQEKVAGDIPFFKTLNDGDLCGMDLEGLRVDIDNSKVIEEGSEKLVDAVKDKFKIKKAAKPAVKIK